MKLFIPTCTLNFNNIFSTESISPRIHYKFRGFGNPRFYPVEANNIDSVISLYSKFPKFQVNDADMENYPMVIEIDTDDYESAKFKLSASHCGVNVYTCRSTIYLNPFHCYFFIDNEKVLRSVLIKAEQSLENKFSKLYSTNIKVKPFTTNHPNGLDSGEESNVFLWTSLHTPKKDITPYTSNDEAYVDRLKGFIYCYLIGANTSIDKELCQLKITTKALKSSLSAAFNSPEHQPTERQLKLVAKNIELFNGIFKKKDQTVINNQAIIKSNLEKNNQGLTYLQCLNFLIDYNLYDYYCKGLHLPYAFNANSLWAVTKKTTPEAYASAIRSLENAVEQVEASELSRSIPNHLEDLIQIGTDRQIRITDPSFIPNFYQKIIQSQVNMEYKRIMEQKGLDEPTAIAYNGGMLLKQIMGKQWENSSTQKYINSLLNYFQNNSQFDLLSIGNYVPISFAAFCQKNESIDTLKEYLIQNGINDYRLAFGLLGATRGFASLPKYFTATLIDGDRVYCKNVWLKVHEYLFNAKLSKTEFPDEGKTLQNIETTPSIFLHEQTASVGSAKKDTNYGLHSPKTFMHIACVLLKKQSRVYKALSMADFGKVPDLPLDEFKNKLNSIIEPTLPKNKKDRNRTIDQINNIIELETNRKNYESFVRIFDSYWPEGITHKKASTLYEEFNSELYTL